MARGSRLVIRFDLQSYSILPASLLQIGDLFFFATSILQIVENYWFSQIPRHSVLEFGLASTCFYADSSGAEDRFLAYVGIAMREIFWRQSFGRQWFDWSADENKCTERTAWVTFYAAGRPHSPRRYAAPTTCSAKWLVCHMCNTLIHLTSREFVAHGPILIIVDAGWGFQ